MGKVVHFELPVDDPDRARTFYAEAFGWSFRGWGDVPYWLTDIGADDEPGVEGALIARSELHESAVVVIAVDDVDAAIVDAVEAGAEVVADKRAVPSIGWSAYLRDTEGNVVGLWQSDEAAGETPEEP